MAEENRRRGKHTSLIIALVAGLISSLIICLGLGSYQLKAYEKKIQKYEKYATGLDNVMQLYPLAHIVTIDYCSEVSCTAVNKSWECRGFDNAVSLDQAIKYGLTKSYQPWNMCPEGQESKGDKVKPLPAEGATVAKGGVK